MKVLIIGLGSIGRRHIKNIKAFDKGIQIALWRQQHRDKELGDVQELVSEVFFDQADALAWGCDAAVIANPAPMHLPVALLLARQGAHLFIEKPLSDTLAGIDELVAIRDQRQLTMMVGYVLRFAPPVQALKEAIADGRIGRILSMSASVGRYLQQWRPGDYRAQVSAQKDLGGGVVLELSHEMDYLRWLGGEITQVTGLHIRAGDFDIDVEDVAEISMVLQDKVMAHVHLDMLDRASHRDCRIVGSEGTLTWGSVGGNHQVYFYDGQGAGQVLYEVKGLDPNIMHIRQWKHFFDCINSRQSPLITLEDAQAVLKASLEVLGR